MTEVRSAETVPPSVAGRVRLSVLGMSERSFEAFRLLVELNQPGRLELTEPADADVAVIDLDGLDGATLLEQQRKRFPACPVVGVSLHDEQREQVDGFVAKPLQLDRLTAAVLGVVQAARPEPPPPRQQPVEPPQPRPPEAEPQPERPPAGLSQRAEWQPAAVAQQPVEPQQLAAQQQHAAGQQVAGQQAVAARREAVPAVRAREQELRARTNGMAAASPAAVEAEAEAVARAPEPAPRPRPRPTPTPVPKPKAEADQADEAAAPAAPQVERGALPGAPPAAGDPLVVWAPTRNTDRSPNRAARGVEARSAGERVETPRVLGLFSPTADSGDGSFLALIFKAVEKAHAREKPVELRSPAGWIVLDVQRGMVATDLGKRQLYRLARVSTQTWQWSSRVRRAGLRGAPADWVSVEALLWQLGIWTHGSTLPPGVAPDVPVALWRWPDLTRNAPLDHAVRIAARWIAQPTSLAETVRALGATAAQVNGFFVAAWAAGLIVLPPVGDTGRPDRADRRRRPIGAGPSAGAGASAGATSARRRVLGDLLGRLRDR